MLDYKLIEAFAKVVSEGGFERAAKVLFITQSAVSQRIRQLEDQSGQLLLTRTSPPQPTVAGKALLKHYQQVKLLEEGLTDELTAGADDQGLTRLAIGINADSLASWFIDAIRPLLSQLNLLIDLRVDDQEQTHMFLRDGDVVGCISNESRAMQGCRVEPLGVMNYRLLATPEFISRWFPTGLTFSAVEQAPAVIFNRKDRLHYRFLEKYLCGLPAALPCHHVPAPEQFLQMIAAGFSYGMVPDWQSVDLRNNGDLLELVPRAVFPVELYWHCWNLQSVPLQSFTDQLVRGAQQVLTN